MTQSVTFEDLSTWVLPPYAVSTSKAPHTCNRCNKPALWVQTKKGMWAPIDPDGTSHYAACPPKPIARPDTTLG